jgi:anti-sigma factor RsiW
MNTNTIQTDCRACRNHLPDLLLDEHYLAAHPEMSAHLAACSDCAAELNELRSTFDLLDEWAAPEPSPYFDTRMHALLREAQAEQPEGFFERIRSYVLFSTGRVFRPAVVGALSVAMLLGGGSVGFYMNQMAPHATSATVNDLNILDNNAQALQTMDQLLDDSSSDDNATPPTT